MERDDTLGRALLHRYRFGSSEFDESRMQLTVGGLPVDLELKPLQLLSQLLRRPDEVATRVELLESVWADRVTGEHVLTNAVAKLRKALGETDGARIVTVPRFGYRLVGPVEKIAVGKRLVSQLDLKVGDSVPGRDHFLLESQLATTAGMEVWLARHSKTGDQRVFKFSRDAEHLAVLKREATLYRVLREGLGERVDLLRIFDWNFAVPPYYLECEFGGTDLLQWAEDEAALSKLALQERVGLFLQVAEAVAAAHSVGVLHKDLKPANILVYGSGTPLHVRVADFGSGSLLDPDRLDALGITRLGLTATRGPVTHADSGTPLYLAPELIAGSAPTVQSDVYALGVILYQIATGNLRQPMASGWEQSIPDDLLTADIAGATQLDPQRRISSATELAHRLRTLDIRRNERAELGAARARSAMAERRLELARARRPWVISALAALLLGMTVGVTLYIGERSARIEADRAAAQAEAINRFLSNDLLGAADPSGPGGSHNPSMRDVLARTAAHLDSRFNDQPEVKASVDLALGTAYFGLTDYATAEKYRGQAVTLLSSSQGAGSTAALEAQYQLISILVQTNRLDEAAQLLDRADGLAGARLKQNSRLAFQAHWTRAGYDKLRMDAAAAAADYAAADRVRAAVYPDDDSLLLRLRDAVSWCDVRLGRNEEAERVLRDLMTPAYTPQRVGPLFWAQARIDYGIALRALGNDTGAEHVMTAALQELRTSLGEDHFFVGLVQNELGDLYTRQSRWAEAVTSLNEARRIIGERTGEHGQAALLVGANLGIVQYQMGRDSEAAETLSGIHAELAGQLGEASPQAQSIAFYLAAALNGLGRYAEAGKLAGNLQPSALASAEPRDDWNSRLEQLRTAISLRGKR